VCEDGGYEISYWRAAACGTLAVAATPSLLVAAGFTSAGVTVGSIAASVQGTIGNVAAGGVFAWLQSAGVIGVGYGAGAGIASTAGAICGISKKKSCCPDKN